MTKSGNVTGSGTSEVKRSSGSSDPDVQSGGGVMATEPALNPEEPGTSGVQQLKAHSPYHSRPLDRHRWSDHPEVHGLIDALWDRYFTAFAPSAYRPGRRSLTDPKRQLQVLVLDLFLAWKADPYLSIGVSMSNRGYQAGSRYNALHISPIIIDLVHRAHEVGLIGFWRGNERARMVSRIWASGELVELFEKAKFGVTDIVTYPARETVILSRGRFEREEGKDLAKYLEYDDTPDTIAMRGNLQRYNQLLNATFVDDPTLDFPRVFRPAEGSNERDTWVDVSQNAKFSRRIFYRGQWQLGGRIHGGFWQRIPESARARLHLNDLPVVEDDYSGTHVALLYGMEGMPLDRDAYTLDISTIYDKEQLRDWIKILSLVTINADDEKVAFRAFRQKQPAGSPAKKFTNAELATLLSAFKDRHPAIARHLCTDKGVELMAIDGRITASIIDQFTAIDVPVLTVFDSYIIDMFHAEDLRAAMAVAMDREVPGASTSIDRAGVGADRSGKQGSIKAMLADWHAVRSSAKRSQGYLARQTAFFEWRKTLPGYTEIEVLDKALASIRGIRQRLNEGRIA